MKKLFRWAAVVALVMVLLIIGFLFFGLNPLVRASVMRAGNYATGQETTLESVNLSLAGGTLQMGNLEIANPSGFTAKKALTMAECKVGVQSRSLFTDTVVIDEITIRGVEVTIEQQGIKNNLGVILEHIQKQTAAGGSSETSPGKKLSIRSIKMTGTRVHLVGIVNTSLSLGDMEMKEPTNPDGRPMRIADVVAKVLITIARQVLENPQIPGAFKDGMGNAQKMIDDMRKQVLEGGLKDAGKKLDEATKGIGDLFKRQDGK